MLKIFLAVIILAAALSGCGYRGYGHHGSNPAPSTYYDEDNSGGGGGGGGGGC